MSTLLEIKTDVASMLELTLADLTVNGQDLFLTAINRVRRRAEMGYDFNFTRKTVTVSVNGATGGSLDSAVAYGTATPVTIKTIVDVGVFDDDTNFRPVEWTTVAEGLERQREEQPRFYPRYPTDGQSIACGQARFVFSGSSVFFFPKDSTATYTLGMEVYALTPDWDEDFSVSDTWTTFGEDYLLWSTVIQLNKRFKVFVPRTEGNLSEPSDLAQIGLQSIQDWDTERYEAHRRHGR